MNMYIYHCQKCKRLWAPQYNPTEVFHHAYLPATGITLSFKCCNEEMYLIKPNDRVVLLTDTTTSILAEDEQVSSISSSADTLQVPAIAAPSLPADTAHTTHTTPAKRYGLFSLPSRIPVKEVA